MNAALETLLSQLSGVKKGRFQVKHTLYMKGCPRAAAHRRVARAGWGRIPGPRQGKYPLSKPLLCALKQVAPT